MKRKLLSAALLAVSALGFHANAQDTSASIEDGIYYLYDANFNGFLSRGNAYGTETAVDKYGVPFTWNSADGSIEYLDRLNSTEAKRFLFITGTAIYTDGVSTGWKFVQTDGGYYLQNADETVYVTHEMGDYGEYAHTTTDQTQATVWTFKTQEERNAIVNAYPVENKQNVIAAASLSDVSPENFETYLSSNYAAKDMTEKVGTPKFNEDKGAWTWVSRAGNPTYGTNWTEVYQGAGYYSQEISGLSKGLYKVTVNAFERGASYALCNELGEKGYEIVTSYFAANDEQVQLRSWYSEKEGTNDPDNTSQAAAAFNNDKYKNEVYVYLTEGENLIIKLAKPSTVPSSWVLFNNVTLTYYDSSVSEEESAAILQKAEEQMNNPMKPSLYKALAAAKAAFESSKGSVPYYNALQAAIENTYTSVDSYKNMYDSYLKKVEDFLATTNFYNTTTQAYADYLKYKAAYENYKQEDCEDIENADANAMATKVGDNDGTRRYTNSAFQDLLIPNWTINGKAASTTGSGFYVNTWSGENAGSGDASDFANPFFESWTGSGSLAAATIEGTIGGLNANSVYSIAAAVRVQGSSKVDGSITMEVLGGEPVDVTQGNAIEETGRYIGTYTAKGVTDADGNLTVKFTIAANSNISWLAFRNINYAVSEGEEIVSDFTELNALIAEAESNTLGFEKGEYAPYNNIEAMTALAAAKAVDQSQSYLASYITPVIDALKEAKWNANAEEVNAFYDGTFKNTTEGTVNGDNVTTTTPAGWTPNANLRRVLKDEVAYPGLKYATDKSAIFSWSGGIAYGEQTGYEMPLKQAVYNLTFKVTGWNNETVSAITVSVKNGENGLEEKTLAVPTTDIVGKADGRPAGFTDYEVIFPAPEAGNYVFSIKSGNNFVLTDIELKKAIDPSVSVEVSPAGYATFSSEYPLDLSAIDGGTAYIVADEAEGEYIKLTEQAEAVPANTGLIIAGEGTVTIPVVATANPLEKENYLVAVSKYTEVESGYVLGWDGNDPTTVGFYVVDETPAPVKAGQAYLELPSSEEEAAGIKVLRFAFGDEIATAIETAEVADADADGAIYNVAGQQVGKDYKGIVIKNGKKYLNK